MPTLQVDKLVIDVLISIYSLLDFCFNEILVFSKFLIFSSEKIMSLPSHLMPLFLSSDVNLSFEMELK